MSYLHIALTLIVSLGILNVWVLRRDQQTPFRGQGAKTLREEFAVYGLPTWVFTVIGVVKVSLATALLLSLWKPAAALAQPSALALALIMVVAFVMHLKVKDAAIKAVPSLAVLAMCLGIALL